MVRRSEFYLHIKINKEKVKQKKKKAYLQPKILRPSLGPYGSLSSSCCSGGGGGGGVRSLSSSSLIILIISRTKREKKM